MGEGEELIMDTTAYTAFCEFTAEWPCLTFDVIPDSLGDNRTAFPMSAQLVCGTQRNDDLDMEEEDQEEDATICHSTFKHAGGINRMRVCRHARDVVAVWGDKGAVTVYNLAQQLQQVEQNSSGTSDGQQIFQHQFSTEGYAMDWSPVAARRLATGDCSSQLAIWDPTEHGWEVRVSSGGHTDSVEDVQWSPNEPNVLASCSVDKTIRIWDIRAQLRPVLSVNAHDADVNVLSWNRREQHLLVSGGDEGAFKVWDLRTFMSGSPEAVATFKWHSQPITSVEWHPIDASVIAVSGDDHQVSLWDMAVEDDGDANQLVKSDQSTVPPQLLFVHQGQKDIKEVHWHMQVPGMCISTAASGFNIFKTISV
ncbi:uncharacterized protein MONBRDRAFT_29376 [Monosiga brevicollis MX1]|uniref:Glutamate-rich WD repeat-containing protein 1 n=1 Tax=Monosiga brevicollis TaxID=81824 RepID=A9VAX0_MONBE|nr:uncharacterized protein MONBRDRAFT_29376 [Monosiga brevicollis MX1]EDQ85238.1 predicted protein [Monosiga brevicollis MX1]|eukprot:XP_001749859.1 hypothetical protein [Monosiga brevicollis MX1]